MRSQTEYIIHETRWLLSFGRPALEIARQLNRKPSSLYKMSERHNLPDIREAFAPYARDHAA